MSKKSSSHHYHRTFIVMVIFAFILAVFFAFVFNLLFKQVDTLQYQMLKLEKKVKTVQEQMPDTVVDEDDDEILPPKLVINEAIEHDVAWLRKDLKTVGVRFFYPSDYIVSGDESFLYVSPKPEISNETPLPVVTIKKVPNKSGLKIDAFAREYYSGKAVERSDSEELNGMLVKKIEFEEVSDTYATCGRYIFEVNEESFLEVAPYECFEWEHFDTFIESFTRK